MITEKSKNRLRRAVAWAITWKGYLDAKLATTEEAEHVWSMALHEIDQLSDEWQVTECLDGRR